MKNQSGFSLVETMVALGLVVLVGFILISGVHRFNQMARNAQLASVVDRQIKDIVENIRPNINLYQIDYSLTMDERLQRLERQTLPMAWDMGVVAEAAVCPACAGRFGYVIHPFPAVPGLFLLTVRMTHSAWGDAHRDYSFLVTTK